MLKNVNYSFILRDGLAILKEEIKRAVPSHQAEKPLSYLKR